MASDQGHIALRVEGLGKRYRLGEREPYLALRDVISGAVRRRPGSRRRRDRDDTFWALRDVSFEVPFGEAIAIVGRNGAGKSTLLKLLSRITEPTEGVAVVAGRVGALLEVGTGFHPELTGRDNVVLNGAILGMRRREVLAKFDDIVAFAGVERFVDTPVKRYSSGMQARLAFAVAAFLETDILVVDEVLAVGDAEFQKKCMGMMGEAAQGGRTVLFVSHNMTAVESLCRRAVWLENGRVVADGPTPDVVAEYLSTSFSQLSEQHWPDLETAPGNDAVRIRRAAVRPEGGSPSDPIDVRTPVAIEFEYWNLRPDAQLNLSLQVYNSQGVMVFNALPYLEKVWQGRPFPRGLYRDTCHIPADLLNDGTYEIELLVVDSNHLIYKHDGVLVFEVKDDPYSREGWFGTWQGAVRPQLAWETEQLLVDEADLEAARE
jgi:lipopolysaccharide transport system ATP-binding protein